MPVVEADLAIARAGEVVESYAGERSSLIHVLQDIQGQFDYLPRESLETVSERLRLPLSEVLRVATFYAGFSLEPRGEHLVTVCMGTACHVRGAATILERLEDMLGISAGHTTPDGEFTLQTVNCLGACALGPLVSIDGQYHGKLNPARLRTVMEEFGVRRNAAKD